MRREVKKRERGRESEGREQLRGRGNNNGEIRGADGRGKRRSVKRSRRGRMMPEERMKCHLYCKKKSAK